MSEQVGVIGDNIRSMHRALIKQQSYQCQSCSSTAVTLPTDKMGMYDDPADDAVRSLSYSKLLADGCRPYACWVQPRMEELRLLQHWVIRSSLHCRKAMPGPL